MDDDKEYAKLTTVDTEQDFGNEYAMPHFFWSRRQIDEYASTHYRNFISRTALFELYARCEHGNPTINDRRRKKQAKRFTNARPRTGGIGRNPQDTTDLPERSVCSLYEAVCDDDSFYRADLQARTLNAQNDSDPAFVQPSLVGPQQILSEELATPRTTEQQMH